MLYELQLSLRQPPRDIFESKLTKPTKATGIRIRWEAHSSYRRT